MATDGHGGDFVPTGPTHDQPYEPDKFAVKTILVVPIVVIATGFVAFVITDLIFGAFFAPKTHVAEPEVASGAAYNAAPMNDRFARMSSTDPTAEVQQPRLEGIQLRQAYGKNGNPNGITSEMISTQPAKEKNSPRYHAEDLRPDRVAATSTTAKDPQTGTVRIPVDQAIELLTDPRNADLAKTLPAREGAVRLDDDPRFGWDRPKESNGGNARLPAPTRPAEPKKAADGKEPPRKDGEAEKKEPEKKEPEKGAEPKKQ
jgi:hypothetical protein